MQQQKNSTKLSDTADNEENDKTTSISGDIRATIQKKPDLENDTITEKYKENNEFRSYDMLSDCDSLNILENTSLGLQDDFSNYQCTDNIEGEESSHLQIAVDAIDNDINLNQARSNVHTPRSEVVEDMDLNEKPSQEQRKRLAKLAFKSFCVDLISDNEDFSAGSSDEWAPFESENEDEENRKTGKKKKRMNKRKRDLEKSNEKEIPRKKAKRVNRRKSESTLRKMGKPHKTRTGKLKDEKSLKPNPCEREKCARGCF